MQDRFAGEIVCRMCEPLVVLPAIVQRRPEQDVLERLVRDFPRVVAFDKGDFGRPAALNNPFFFTQRLHGAAFDVAGPNVFPPSAKPKAPNPKNLENVAPFEVFSVCYSGLFQFFEPVENYVYPKPSRLL